MQPNKRYIELLELMAATRANVLSKVNSFWCEIRYDPAWACFEGLRFESLHFAFLLKRHMPV